MPITYLNNYFRAGANNRRFLMPGDDDMAINHYHLTRAWGVFRDVFLDTAAENLVAMIGRKGWDIPDVSVTFDVAHTDNDPVHRPYHITIGHGPDMCELYFTRAQYAQPDYPVLISGAVTRITVPEHELHVYEDGSGSYFQYVGKNWARDAAAFQNTYKPGGRGAMSNNTGRRLYLAHERRGAAYVHTTHGGAEADRVGHEPESKKLRNVHCTIAEALDNVTARLAALPDHDGGPHVAWMAYAQCMPIVAPDPMPVLYVTYPYYSGDDALQGPLLSRGGKRLCDLSFERNAKHPVPPLALEGFRYGFAHAPYESQSGYWGDSPADPDMHVARVNLKWSNDVYVVDETPLLMMYDNFRDMAFKKHRMRIDDDHEKIMVSAVARTMTPLASYGGGFQHPIYLINRPLWADEAADVTDSIRTPIDHQSGKTRFVLNPV
jgi:hypothetical protein